MTQSTESGEATVQERLREFVRWAISEGPFQGCHLDGGDIQEKAEKLGLLIKTKYDPAVHGESAEADVGDDWYIFSPWLAAASPELRSPDSCARCGHPRREHSYNGACYGLCGEFVPSPELRSPGREEIIEQCARVVDDLCISEAGLFDAAHSGGKGEARSNALYDAHQAIRALLALPHAEQGAGEKPQAEGERGET